MKKRRLNLQIIKFSLINFQNEDIKMLIDLSLNISSLILLKNDIL